MTAKKYLRSESGQSVILISMVLLSFIMFFSFAVNTGVLITAKISVQSAADAAAYAGAATQARQLNAISYLNYDMLRQYKKFVYRYAFMGSIASKDFPNRSEGVTGGKYGYPKVYYPDATSGPQIIGLKIPVVCIPITSSSTQSDNCVTLNLPSTTSQINSFFPAGGLTSITQQLLQTTAQIQAMQQEQCGKTSATNLFVLIEWLMRGDISPAAISTTLDQMTDSGTMSAADKAKLVNIITNLVNGLGLYPRNILTLMRIESLAAFLNTPAQKDLQKDKINSLEHAPNAEINERTIQAFKSATTNLNNEVISHDSLVMQELENDNQITITPVKASFNAYVQYLVDAGGSGPSGVICNSKIVPFKALQAPVGVTRDSKTPVHYAVKLTAKAKLLFLPPGTPEIELEAFASAKPFGSRIGPHVTGADFVENITPTALPTDPINDCSGDAGCDVPKVKINGTDEFYSQAYLQALAQIGVTVDPAGGKTYTFQGMANGMAPVPFEVGHYNILPPPQDVGNMAYEYIPYATDQNSKIFRFYAPIFTGSASPQSKISAMMSEVFGTTAVPGHGSFPQVDMMALKSTLESQMNAYVNGPLNAGGDASEHGETTTFAAIELPMAPPPPPQNPVTASPNKYWLTTSSEVLSSWAPPNGKQSSGSGLKPRFGYSVKFVAMQDLLAAGMNNSDDDESKVSH